MKARFYSTCVMLGMRNANALNDMIDEERKITRRTFCRNVHSEDRKAIERRLGYLPPPGGLTMARDFLVSYYRSTFRGKRVYFFRWSAIEHLFMEETDDA